MSKLSRFTKGYGRLMKEAPATMGASFLGKIGEWCNFVNYCRNPRALEVCLYKNLSGYTYVPQITLPILILPLPSSYIVVWQSIRHSAAFLNYCKHSQVKRLVSVIWKICFGMVHLYPLLMQNQKYMPARADVISVRIPASISM
jgi:hypothetical protein